jgi:hypothetical protein
MSTKNRWHVLLFAIVVGFSIYIGRAAWSAYFIVSLPQDKEYVTGIAETDNGYEPVAFKNTFERLKYDHNVRMLERNKYLVYGSLILSGLLGVFLFVVVARWRRIVAAQQEPMNEGIIGFILGIAVATVVPMVLGMTLPAPSKWFPREMTQAAIQRRETAMTQLRSLAREIDAEDEQATRSDH